MSFQLFGEWLSDQGIDLSVNADADSAGLRKKEDTVWNNVIASTALGDWAVAREQLDRLREIAQLVPVMHE